jgi:hypothetical protein
MIWADSEEIDNHILVGFENQLFESFQTGSLQDRVSRIERALGMKVTKGNWQDRIRSVREKMFNRKFEEENK